MTKFGPGHLAALICSTWIAASASAGESRCPFHYANARPPAIMDASVSVGAMELCSQGYGLVYSSEAKSPIFAAELLSPDRVLRAYKRQNRANDFRPDERVARRRSEEHTSELQSLMRISYDVFGLKKKTTATRTH